MSVFRLLRPGSRPGAAAHVTRSGRASMIRPAIDGATEWRGSSPSQKAPRGLSRARGGCRGAGRHARPLPPGWPSHARGPAVSTHL